MSEADDSQRREVYYSGRVQGVGFRYTTRHIAARYHVRGFVRNLPDGRVQVVVEGPADQVEAFLNEVRSEFGDCIRRVDQTSAAPTGAFSGFEIRF